MRNLKILLKIQLSAVLAGFLGRSPKRHLEDGRGFKGRFENRTSVSDFQLEFVFIKLGNIWHFRHPAGMDKRFCFERKEI